MSKRIEEEWQERIGADIERDFYDMQERLKRCEFSCEVYRNERDHARMHYENTVKILMGIHNLLYPPTFKQGDKTSFFNSPHVHEQMQALSDAIRAIPDELAKASNPVM